MARQPLHGVRVIDMSHVIAGPLASFYLAQLGAEVIKIEKPAGGDVMRASRPGGATGTNDDLPTGFAALNAGKRSFACDIRQPRGAELIRTLARDADVFIENFRPGVVAKYGLDAESIRAVRPDIVYCSISGYGQQGEWAGRGAYDHVVQALTGMMMMSGDHADAPPLKVGFPVIDVAAGLLGALSITAALHRRARDCVGETIDASMVQASLMLMYPNASSFMTDGIEPQRVGNRGYTSSPTADTYQCADGWLATAANTPAQFRKLTAVLGLEALCEDAELLDLAAFNAPGGGFVVARRLDELRERFREAFACTSAADMEVRLNAVGVPAARVRRLGEFLDEVGASGAVALRGSRYARGSGQPLTTPGLGFCYASSQGRNATQARDAASQSGAPAPGAPALGADTDALLSGLGLNEHEIDALHSAGIVK